MPEDRVCRQVPTCKQTGMGSYLVTNRYVLVLCPPLSVITILLLDGISLFFQGIDSQTQLHCPLMTFAISIITVVIIYQSFEFALFC